MARDKATRITWQDWRHLLTAGVLVGGVVGTLLLGGRLRAEPSDEPPRDLAAILPPAPAAAEVAPEPTLPPLRADAAPPQSLEPPPAASSGALPPAEPPPLPDLSPAPERGAEDAWTLQFMVTCERETAERLERDPGAAELMLIPVRLDGRDCYRVCWGRYATREAALADPGVPASLTALGAEPLPRRVAELQ